MSRRRIQKKYTPLDWLDFLLSAIYDRMTLHDPHLDDLRQSALTDETIAAARIRTVPPWMIPKLLRRSPPKGVRSAYAIPYFSPGGGLMDVVRLKIFPSLERKRGVTKYLQAPGSAVRIYFPIMVMNRVLYSADDLLIIEGEKKSLAVAQTGAAVIGLAGCEGWHLGGSERLHPDFDDIGLDGRTVHLWFDVDIKTNPMVHYAADRLGLALKARGVKALTIVRPELTS
jgi:hypothetical protein